MENSYAPLIFCFISQNVMVTFDFKISSSSVGGEQAFLETFPEILFFCLVFFPFFFLINQALKITLRALNSLISPWYQLLMSRGTGGTVFFV